MNDKQFNEVVDRQFSLCREILKEKSIEYTDGYVDKLRQFKAAASLESSNPKAALFGMLTKHLCSLADMCADGDAPIYKWDEKITDSINYLLLLRALVEEDVIAEGGYEKVNTEIRP